MLHRFIKLICFLLGLVLFQSAFSQDRPGHVVVISIDGFRPEFYLDSSMPTPNLQEMYKQGVAAKEVTGIFPTVTYPSHTTLITGATPKDHGIYYNTKIEEDGSAGGWVYDFKEIKSKTLWQAAKEKGLVTASVSWPVSVNAEYIDYNIPEFWSFENPMDRRGATSEKAHPKGLFEEVVKNATGTLEINDYNLSSMSMDQNLARIAGYLLREYKPNLLTIHLPLTDGAQHRQGRKGNLVRKAIAGADTAVGIIRDALDKAGIGNETVIIVTGDHGFVDVHTQIAPNVILRQHGLHQQSEGRPKAFFFSAGGSAFLHLEDGNDRKTLERIKQIFAGLPLEVRSTFEIIEEDKISERGGDPRAKLALGAKRGYSFSNDADGDLMTYKRGGKHGFYPNFHDIATGFVGYGKGMQEGEIIESMYLEDVGKIVASLLQIELNQGTTFYHSTIKK
ncbi:Predicted pyrophosphatase or phosphodiesterase, AlkP superfamily [Flagellimonas taeanensis]|uniref:Predicted pyrophosphatase or phosphodiesterase, AlkP superfamily n=1 Tax=Flagellimonas taeanensis TaxID=1005926 RepID=A0A1M6WX47_9FLAO|nr:ectonucleotide pyrophosphatase/phosphodiesterase [Allomuricauda taeanensis]SFB99661.1 Predicted pyrophosphatase or phosphodiesterase, AlkP superfamily [Allomuricauda taeanensis]SHK98256.1 Predicted pyrophosphatase or phosphodiesterase, AlkP superfamily [Allomuricauda taeanensis]